MPCKDLGAASAKMHKCRAPLRTAAGLIGALRSLSIKHHLGCIAAACANAHAAACGRKCLKTAEVSGFAAF